MTSNHFLFKSSRKITHHCSVVCCSKNWLITSCFCFQSYDNGSQYVFYTEDGKQAQCLEDIEGRTVHVADTFSKPRMSYAQLIAEALMNAGDGMLTLSEIYQAISAKHPYYRYKLNVLLQVVVNLLHLNI